MTQSHLMQAAVLDAQDGPFRLANVTRPAPAPGQVLVRIAASGVNPLDLKIRAGKADHARQPLPAILGIDLAGTVVAVGEGVSRFHVGDEVFGMTGGVGGRQGSLAEYAAVNAELLALKPANLSMREAAALPLVFITAWEGLVDRAALAPAQTLLVHGGNGGVGRMAIQIARARGARVFATGGNAHRREIEALGAVFIERDAPIADYVASHTGGRGFDTVFDSVGGATLDASFWGVARFGRVVSVLGWGTHSLAPLSFRAATYSGVFTLLPLLTGDGTAHHGEILDEARRLVEAGQVLPKLDRRSFTLATVADAHQAIEDRSALGKVVVNVAAA